MKKVLKALALLVAAVLLTACGAGVSEGQPAELFAVNVGKGDALLIRVDGAACLIDAGKACARGKVLTAMAQMGVTALDAVFLTHTDDDHAGGLEWLADSAIPVGAWYAPAFYTGVKAKKHPLAKAAQARGQEPQWLRRGDVIQLGDAGAAFRVLAPAEQFDDKDDNNSLVMMLVTSQGKILLTGDMELPEEAALLARGDDLSCAVLKVPNHGDDDTTSQSFADAAGAQVAVISTDGQEKPGTPDPGVLSRLKAAGSDCYVTEYAGLGLRVTLADGRATVESVEIEAPAATGVSIQSVISGDDLIALSNSGAACDLTGWYLYSDRGNELYAFPDDTLLPAGGSLVVGTLSSDGGYDLLWNDKKVIHKSKPDTIYLYDRYGRIVDAMDNG